MEEQESTSPPTIGNQHHAPTTVGNTSAVPSNQSPASGSPDLQAIQNSQRGSADNWNSVPSASQQSGAKASSSEGSHFDKVRQQAHNIENHAKDLAHDDVAHAQDAVSHTGSKTVPGIHNLDNHIPGLGDHPAHDSTSSPRGPDGTHSPLSSHNEPKDNTSNPNSSGASPSGSNPTNGGESKFDNLLSPVSLPETHHRDPVEKRHAVSGSVGGATAAELGSSSSPSGQPHDSATGNDSGGKSPSEQGDGLGNHSGDHASSESESTATGKGKKRARNLGKAIIALVAGVCVMILLIVSSASPSLTGSSGGQDSNPQAGCLDTGTSTTTGVTAGNSDGGSIEQQQLSNAKAIDKAASDLGLSGVASRIAIITAVGESDLIDVNHGDNAVNPDGTMNTSLGLFQQQPSMGWGTNQQVMDPAYAATSFLIGQKHDGKGGLVTVPNWETRTDISMIIHTVQQNSDSNYYTSVIPRADAIIAKAGINVSRAGTTTKYDSVSSSGGTPGTAGDDVASGTCGSTTGGYNSNLVLQNGPCPLGPAPSTKTTCDQAIAFETEQMNNHSTAWNELCLHIVTLAYGGVWLGLPSAQVAGEQVKADGKMQPPTKDYKSIPRGAVLWYSHPPYGHVAISIGNGMAISSDAPVDNGSVGIVPISFFETNWHQTFMGWSAPVK